MATATIVTIAHFQKANVLNIPMSVDAPNPNPAIKTANESDYLQSVIDTVQKELLLNALGLGTYNTLKLALADIDNPLYASYKKLVEGEEYDGKVWIGLQNDLSFIAFKVYDEFLSQTNERLSGVGNVNAEPEKARLITPAYKIAMASQEFFKGYQGGYLKEPIILGNFIDYFGQSDDINVSFYQYMLDKKDNFEGFDIDKFLIYDDLNVKNSFGI